MKKSIRPINSVIKLSTKNLSLVCLSMLVIIFLFGLWPFRFNPPNAVEWLKGEPGVRFSGNGHIYSQGNLSALLSDHTFSLEIWVRPAPEANNRLGYIFSLWERDGEEIFSAVQWKDTFILLVPPPPGDPSKGHKKRGEPHILVQGQEVLITLTSGPTGTKLYANGIQASEFSGFPLLGNRLRGNWVLIVGNSPQGRNYWAGDLLGMALYNNILTSLEVRQNYSSWANRDYGALKVNPGSVALYPFNERRGNLVRNLASDFNPLIKPALFLPPQKVILEWPTKQYMKRFSFYQDAAVNLFGFIPFGFFVAILMFRFNRLPVIWPIALTVILGSIFSLSIELAQVWLPSRDSSASDLVFNILGTFCGAGFIKFNELPRRKRTGYQRHL